MSKENYWVITKGGAFYRPMARGYTEDLEQAGLFQRADALDSASRCDSVRSMPYLAAKYGLDNLRFDPETNHFWRVDHNEQWYDTSCGMERWMVQHQSRPGTLPADSGIFPEPQITAAEVKSRRDETGEGMMEAKHRLRQARYAECMETFRKGATLEEKVDYILDWIMKKETGT